ncbi:alpha-amlyase [Marinilabiliaceae bacterium JC017]|nr:alpha-amlyase [Marinilabiliaceae bacterium JC017]
MKFLNTLMVLVIMLLSACQGPTSKQEQPTKEVPFVWDNANIYFLLTDRFKNGSTENDVNFERTSETAKLRGFMGGDLKGITQKIKDGYFTDLGINALWFSPVMEQIHGGVDEGTGNTYAFHGYWTKDWTSLEPNFGTEEDLMELVETAHAHGIRILLDVIINHTGPVTKQDPVWPADWVRTTPTCKYQDYETTVNCTLTDNLPDVKTESNEEVDVPAFLMEKWEKEGRLEKEMDELNAFFARTGYVRSPRNYIIKWLTDLIRKYGIDGYRIDTAKHTEESVWGELWKEAVVAFSDWKAAHPDQLMDNNPFYMVGEVYGYGISGELLFDFGDRKVDYFKEGFHSLINFEFKGDANKAYEPIFSKYSDLLHGPLKGKSVVNYLSSHDDGSPFDQDRTRPMEAGTKLLLCPGASQVYYGDESSRELIIEGTQGDATLRSFMNWDEMAQNVERNGYKVQDILAHWQKLGRFRQAHLSVGAGVHQMMTESPYVFKRTYKNGSIDDKVVVGLDLAAGKKTIDVAGVFENGVMLKDYYSGKMVQVKKGKVEVDSTFDIVLLGLE